jgi:excisionase family DNA binding protein
LARPSITTAQAAELLGVSPQTVQKWADAGHLSAWRTVGGHRRVDAESVQKMIDARRGHDGASPAPAASGGTPPSAAAVIGASSQGATAPGQLSIVVVEDDHLTSLILKGRLEQMYPSAVVTTFANGFAALMSISRNVPHLLISDIDLPGLDGLAMLRQLREDSDTQSMAAVLVSGYAREALERFGPIPGDVPLLRKPYEDEDLQRVLQQVLSAFESADRARATAA